MNQAIVRADEVMARAALDNRMTKSRGRLVAEVISGSWRASPPALENSAEELEEVLPLLLLSVSGVGALSWWKARHSSLRASRQGFELQQKFRQHALHTALHEQAIKHVISLMHSAGVDPLLVKGWAVARLYPEPGLRPYGDIDLCVSREQYPRAVAAMNSPEGKGYWVDLHEGVAKLDDQGFETLHARSQVVKLDDVEVRVPGVEDHLRILCVHLLRHGAWRPLWLCDVAALLETRAANFDWGRCLGEDPRRADWVACALGLAHQLLGARVEGTPVETRARRLPPWLTSTVLGKWGEPYRHRVHMEVFVRHPVGMLKEFRHHWPNPIEATINMHAPFNNAPRLPFQIGDSLTRAAKFISRVPRLLRPRS